MDFIWPPNIGLNNNVVSVLDHITQTQHKTQPTYIFNDNLVKK